MQMFSQIKQFKKLRADKGFREQSFSLLTDVIAEQVKAQGVDNLNSDDAVCKIKNTISQWDDVKFAFLLCHSCYIPDYYPVNGSEEKLFSKLAEYLVSEWGVRLGYESIQQTEQATKEDVTFFKGNEVVVCDVKSSRLGRSQKSPNVKDAIRPSAYEAWRSYYHDKNSIGGFATFSSLMEWADGSEVHTYLTDAANPIMLIYNEYLSFMLLKKNNNPNLLFETLRNYKSLFPQKLKKQEAKTAFQCMIRRELKSLDDENCFEEFLNLSQDITQKYVCHAIKQLENKIHENIEAAEKEVRNMQPEDVRKKYSELKAESLNKNYNRILRNISRFRVVKKPL